MTKGILLALFIILAILFFALFITLVYICLVVGSQAEYYEANSKEREEGTIKIRKDKK